MAECHRVIARANIHATNNPIPTSEKPPSGVLPRTLKIEPSRKITDAKIPAMASHRPASPARVTATEITTTTAAIDQMIGIRPCS
jgi:hypothetical protein